MAEEKFISSRQKPEPLKRPLVEPGYRYSPRRVVSRPINYAQSSAQTPQALSSQPAKMVDSFVPAKRRPKAVQTLKPALPRQHRSQVLKRQFVDRAAQHTKQDRQQRKLQVKAFVLGGAMTMLILGGFLVAVNLKKPSASSSTDTLGLATENNVPNEVAQTMQAINNYKVSATSPRYLRIPKLQVLTRVLAVESNLRGEPVAPANIFDAGWLKTTAKPGENGASLLIGAVAGPSKAGVFANLSTLAVGDEIQVEQGNGKTQVFKVVRSYTYPADSVDMTAVTKSAIAGKSGLNLLASSGRFNVKTNQFEPRIVVFAVQN